MFSTSAKLLKPVFKSLHPGNVTSISCIVRVRNGARIQYWMCICRRVYNIVDDDPSPREEVFLYARDLVMKKWPGKIEPLLEKMETSVINNGSGRGEKRVCNVRMKRELGVSLVFSSYKSGLQNIIDQMGDDEPF